MTTLRLSGWQIPMIAAPWQRPLALLALLWVVILALLHGDAAHLLSIWWHSSTFNHCLLIVPILAWLVWLRAGELAKLSPRPWAPGLLWIAGGAVSWLLGEAAGIALLRQLGLLVMLQGTVPTLLGPQVTRGLAFPLFYSFFLVPVGEELVPPMQMLTADMAMALLRLFGIPAYIEGIFITTPAGLFAVAEACSGVKFLVAMAALAVLTAHLCFDSWSRRAIFLAVALVVPILANGFRAFSTMWIAEHWGLEFAAGADHVIYGWFFFGIVIALVGALSWRWFDREPDAIPIDGAALARSWAGGTAPAALVVSVAALLVVAPMLWLTRTEGSDARFVPLAGTLAVPGYAPARPLDDWRPRFAGADRLDCVTLAPTTATGGTDGPVDICLARYRYQDEGRELIGFGQGAADPESVWRWSENLPPLGSMQVEHIASAHHRAVATLYAVGTTRSASTARIKLATVRARLARSDERAAALLVSARAEAGGRAAIARFLDAAGGGDALLARLTADR